MGLNYNIVKMLGHALVGHVFGICSGLASGSIGAAVFTAVDKKVEFSEVAKMAILGTSITGSVVGLGASPLASAGFFKNKVDTTNKLILAAAATYILTMMLSGLIGHGMIQVISGTRMDLIESVGFFALGAILTVAPASWAFVRYCVPFMRACESRLGKREMPYEGTSSSLDLESKMSRI